jgi:poly(3-hydroxyalkanoate) synthetase
MNNETKYNAEDLDVNSYVPLICKTRKINIKIMSNNKQTAVEQFAIALYENGFLQGNGDEIQELLEQAKEMEKEQKRKDFTDGYMHGNEPLNHDVIDKWYNETYGGSK